uniref:Uncharacterized protein n=1 Tax=Opuntia streptacantha TaxID=393608 RepID=A0A7C9EP45_OPUST
MMCHRGRPPRIGFCGWWILLRWIINPSHRLRRMTKSIIMIRRWGREEIWIMKRRCPGVRRIRRRRIQWRLWVVMIDMMIVLKLGLLLDLRFLQLRLLNQVPVQAPNRLKFHPSSANMSARSLSIQTPSTNSSPC